MSIASATDEVRVISLAMMLQGITTPAESFEQSLQQPLVQDVQEVQVIQEFLA